ncbi:MAG TPA: Ig-like domain-containing protein [Chitinophagaceae bacterium]
MKKLPALYFLIIACIILISLITGTGCANIIPPTGGPRDSLPPVLVSAVPKDSTTDFNTQKIVLTFDEYVELDQKITEDFIVSPNPENLPLVENKLKTVTIKLKDSLKPNTTYSLDFGNSLKDVNEGNVLKNFTYVFSTGKSLDDGTISGKVTIAETGEADSTLIVLLHSNLNDSAVKKLKPDYYTRLDSSGNFHFRYLPHQKFAIYVLPNDFSKRYDDSTKVFAFYNSTADVDSNNERIQLYAYQQEKPSEKTAAQPVTTGKKNKSEEEKRLRVTTNLENNEQDLLGNLELAFSKSISSFDSSKIAITDTNFKSITGYTIKRDTTPAEFYIQYKWPENTAYKLIIQKDAFADSTGITLAKSDTISFTTRKESQYGSVRLHFNNLDLSKNPVLQFVQSDNIIKSVPLVTNEWSARLFEPGEYELRLLDDDNKNGVWDPGKFDKKQQPEIVRRIPRKLNIKANWDNDVDIIL